MPTITTEKVQDTIVKALATMGPEADDITLDATFEPLDIDSLDLAELSQIIDDELGVELTSDDVQRIKTVGDAVDVIVAKA